VTSNKGPRNGKRYSHILGKNSLFRNKKYQSVTSGIIEEFVWIQAEPRAALLPTGDAEARRTASAFTGSAQRRKVIYSQHTGGKTLPIHSPACCAAVIIYYTEVPLLYTEGQRKWKAVSHFSDIAHLLRCPAATSDPRAAVPAPRWEARVLWQIKLTRDR